MTSGSTITKHETSFQAGRLTCAVESTKAVGIRLAIPSCHGNVSGTLDSLLSADARACPYRAPKHSAFSAEDVSTEPAAQLPEDPLEPLLKWRGRDATDKLLVTLFLLLRPLTANPINSASKAFSRASNKYLHPLLIYYSEGAEQSNDYDCHLHPQCDQKTCSQMRSSRRWRDSYR